MFKRKCSNCGEKIDKKFSYCPFCGNSFKASGSERDFGILGRDDNVLDNNVQRNFAREVGLPMGLDKVMNSLLKRLETELQEMQKQGMNVPSGFKIQISSGKPQMKNVKQNVPKARPHVVRISREEAEMRGKLPKKEAKSQVRRFGDLVVYEIHVPGVKSGKDIVITKIEEGIEIKAYSKDKCYYKMIPLKLEIIRYFLKDDKLTLEMRG